MTPDAILERWKGSEDGHQAALFLWANMAARYGFVAANDPLCYTNIELAKALAGQAMAIPSELSLLFAVPNGGLRNVVTALKLKATGVKAGVPDLMLPVARGGYHGMFIELKKPRGSVLQDVQAACHADLRLQGYRVAVCRGWQKAARDLQEYLNLIKQPNGVTL